jgi:hypothetical protein
MNYNATATVGGLGAISGGTASGTLTIVSPTSGYYYAYNGTTLGLSFSTGYTGPDYIYFQQVQSSGTVVITAIASPF